MGRERSPCRRPASAKLEDVLRSASRVYSKVSFSAKNRPNSANDMPPLCLDLVGDDTEAPPPRRHSFFQHLQDSTTAPPKLPPSILSIAGSVQLSWGSRSVPNQSLTDIVAPAPSAVHRPITKKAEQQPLPPPPRKASHPKIQRSHEEEPVSDDVRQRMAWDYIAAKRAVREAKMRLKRLTAESVRRAKEAAAAKERRDADDYRCLRSARSCKHEENDGSPPPPNERHHEESQCAVPAEGPPPRKPPVPTMRRQRPPSKSSVLHTNPEIEAISSASSEVQEEEGDEGRVVVTSESVVSVKVRLLSGVWIDLSCLGSSTVSHLKALLSLLTMESAKPPMGTAPLLASEFLLRTAVGGAVVENESLGTCIKRHGAELIMELSTLGSAVVSSMAQAHNQLHKAAAAAIKKWAHRGTLARHTLANRSTVQHESKTVAHTETGPETHVADGTDLNRHVKTPAEVAKMTEDVRDANRCVKAQRARLLAKFQCSRHHRKMVEINRDIVDKQRACEASSKSACSSRFCRDGVPNLRYFERQFVALPNLGKLKCSPSTCSQEGSSNSTRKLRRIQTADMRLRAQNDTVVSIREPSLIPRRWATEIDTTNIAKIRHST